MERGGAGGGELCLVLPPSPESTAPNGVLVDTGCVAGMAQGEVAQGAGIRGPGTWVENWPDPQLVQPAGVFFFF